jgi:hypothetical protein
VWNNNKLTNYLIKKEQRRVTKNDGKPEILKRKSILVDFEIKRENKEKITITI